MESLKEAESLAKDMEERRSRKTGLDSKLRSTEIDRQSSETRLEVCNLLPFRDSAARFANLGYSPLVSSSNWRPNWPTLPRSSAGRASHGPRRRSGLRSQSASSGRTTLSSCASGMKTRRC